MGMKIQHVYECDLCTRHSFETPDDDFDLLPKGWFVVNANLLVAGRTRREAMLPIPVNLRFTCSLECARLLVNQLNRERSHAIERQLEDFCDSVRPIQAELIETPPSPETAPAVEPNQEPVAASCPDDDF